VIFLLFSNLPGLTLRGKLADEDQESLTHPSMRSGTVARIAFLLFCCVPALPVLAQQWQPLGPEGGSVRSLTIDPQNPTRIFLGTSAGRLYLSTDSGATWSRFAHLGSPSEMVLDHVVIDPSNPKNLYVAAWNAQAPASDGDLFCSHDGGETWESARDLHGKSIRALAMAPSDPKTLVAGALDGVFRSRDGGDSWERISPENHAELKQVESVAVDPVNPDVIYAGTWHLPWKTDDGGKNWHSIKKGVIDDSDVFSIVVDSANPANVFISACSGIYRSDSAGDLFRKLQGIPYSARRTRALRMDPDDHNVVYAGTTEGLWKTLDGGASWTRMTGTNVIVNDVLIDPQRSSRVLLATDRAGVLASDNGGVTFSSSNRGFSHRQVAGLLVDGSDSSVVFAGVLNDKEFGGTFVSRDRGETWSQISDGLDGHDVLVLRQASDGSVMAGTDRGAFLLPRGSLRWRPMNRLAVGQPEPAAVPAKVNLAAARPRAAELTARITDLQLTPERWFAASSVGFFVSSGSATAWRRLELPGLPGVVSIAAADRMVVAAAPNAITISVNGGESWLPVKSLHGDLNINSVAVEPSGTVWLAAREGVYRSTDMGDSWRRIASLRLANVAGIQFDQAGQRILATGVDSTVVFESLDNGRTWSPINSGWPLRSVVPAQGRLLGVTPFDGVVIQPATSASTR
jgi:photosystem II stability/assembly factor-like uncharacterized protein